MEVAPPEQRSAKTYPREKNRVWGKNPPRQKFSYQIEPQALDLHRENAPRSTKSASGVLYYGYRDYNPETGSWLSRDPIEERGGLNLYGMIGNNAVNYIDVNGRHAYTGIGPESEGRNAGEYPDNFDPNKFPHDEEPVEWGEDVEEGDEPSDSETQDEEDSGPCKCVTKHQGSGDGGGSESHVARPENDDGSHSIPGTSSQTHEDARRGRGDAGCKRGAITTKRYEAKCVPNPDDGTGSESSSKTCQKIIEWECGKASVGGRRTTRNEWFPRSTKFTKCE